ncbi:enoyl-CoA hydratase/isomerase family protein [Alcaligenaceae bacterium]|nr:enoyl-CoA hydratase/isomerase family protein [Alcaligenaceae bacterium]
MTTTVRYLQEGPIGLIQLERPPVNALDFATIEALIAAINRAGADDSVRAVVISSATPGRFCAGLDLSLLQDRTTEQVHELLTRLYLDLHDAQRAIGKPTVAAVSGAARGAGMTLAISCDVIICDENATFGYPEIDIGLIPGIHFVHLPRIVGQHRAFELLFGGQPFDAQQALQLGLVSRIAPAGLALERAKELARLFASKSPQVLKLARAAFTRSHEQDYRQRVADVVDTFCLIAGTTDAQEGLRAFSEKRPPDWQCD